VLSGKCLLMPVPEIGIPAFEACADFSPPFSGFAVGFEFVDVKDVEVGGGGDGGGWECR
jgi:hypothetical protein